MKSIFTKEEQKIIINNYQNNTYQYISNLLDNKFTKEQICGWLNNNGYKKESRNSIFSKSDIEFIKDNYQTMSYKEIGDKLGFSERQIRGRINNMGLSKKRKFNDTYFEEINSCNKAYWLGFIYADGYVIYNEDMGNYELCIQIIDSDYMLLEKFNTELGNAHKVNFKSKDVSFNGYDYISHLCEIRIYSKKIYSDLIKLNIVQNKTNQSSYPICNDYFFHFLRGFIDGDGCLYVSRKNILIVSLTNANLDFLNYLLSTISSILGITGHIYKEKEKKYRLNYHSKNDVKILLDNVYSIDNNCNYLDRKYEIYKSFYNGSPI